MVRLMYGGRTSIYIGVAAAAVTTVLAVTVGLLAGYYRGWIDTVLSRVLDVIWAFPVLLLGIALGTALVARRSQDRRARRSPVTRSGSRS